MRKAGVLLAVYEAARDKHNQNSGDKTSDICKRIAMNAP